MPTEDEINLDNEAAFAEAASNAIASHDEVATAPPLQDVVQDSTENLGALQTPAAPSWREQLGLNDLDDSTAIERLRQKDEIARQSYQQLQYQYQQNQELQARLAAYQAQQQQPVAPAQPEPPKVPWQPVQIDDSYQEWIDPATGTWRENTPHQVVVGFQKQRRALQEFQTKLYTNPHELLAPLIEERAKSLVSPIQEQLQAIQQQFQQQQMQQQIAELVRPMQGQFYVQDANGQLQRDQYGNPILSDAGRQFDQYTAIVRNSTGLTDPRAIAAIAAMALERDQLKAKVSQVPAVQPVPARQQQDQALLAGARNKPAVAPGAHRFPNRGNSVSVSAGDSQSLNGGKVSLASAAEAALSAIGFN